MKTILYRVVISRYPLVDLDQEMGRFDPCHVTEALGFDEERDGWSRFGHSRHKKREAVVKRLYQRLLMNNRDSSKSKLEVDKCQRGFT